MLVLGLDTSSPAVSAALVRLAPAPVEPGARAGLAVVADRSELVAESVVVDARRHGELLAVGVRQVLAGIDRQDLRAVVVGTGPGPFTGLRVGLATAAALSDALDIPAYGVCSLDGLAVTTSSVRVHPLGGPLQPVGGSVHPAGRHVVAVADARRREVYWARYGPSGVRLEGPVVEPPAALAERLRSLPRPPLLVGAGAVLHREAFTGLEVADEPLHPSAHTLVLLAADRIRSSAAADPLTPLYLRRPDALEPGAAKKVTA